MAAVGLGARCGQGVGVLCLRRTGAPLVGAPVAVHARCLEVLPRLTMPGLAVKGFSLVNRGILEGVRGAAQLCRWTAVVEISR